MFGCYHQATLAEIFGELDPNVWVPLAILALTGIGKWIYDTRKEKARQRKIKAYFLFCLERLEASALKQVAHLRRNRRIAIAPIPTEPMVVRSDPGTDLELFKEIGFKDLYEAHPEKRRVELIKVIRAVNGLPHVFRRCTQDIDGYMLEDRLARAEVDSSIGKLQALHGEMAVRRVGSGMERSGHEIFEGIDRIMAAWQSLPDLHIAASKKRHLINPLRELLVARPGLISEWLFRLNEVWQQMDAAHNRAEANKRKFALQMLMSAEIFLELVRSIRAYREK